MDSAGQPFCARRGGRRGQQTRQMEESAALHCALPRANEPARAARAAL
jgi:putative hemolysin